MDQEHPFRIILVIGCAVLLPIVAHYRLESQAAGDRLDRRQEGPFILLTLRPVGILCMLGLMAYMLDPTWMAWSSIALPRWLRWTGVGLGIVSGSLLIWTLHSLGRNLTDTVVTRREHRLVERGPYRFVRHPFYATVALAIAANGLAAANWFLLGSGAAVLVLIAIRTRKEEELLVARFGEAYRMYMERTGRFVPR
jgi:protein-S-isoprenylcysteine O-methyltransferase Ste14